MSKNNMEEVNQVAAAGGGRVAYLTFQSYQQSQGGKYECRVAGPGNNTERLSVCIGECHAWGDGCGLLSISVHGLCLVSPGGCSLATLHVSYIINPFWAIHTCEVACHATMINKCTQCVRNGCRQSVYPMLILAKFGIALYKYASFVYLCIHVFIALPLAGKH